MGKRSTRAKGNQYEREAREVFIHLGYTVWPNKSLTTARFIGGGKFISQDQDIFGCIDFIAMDKNEILFVQVKTFDKDHSDPTKARKAIDELDWPRAHNVELWVLGRLPKFPHTFRTWFRPGCSDEWDSGWVLQGKKVLADKKPRALVNYLLEV